MADVPSNLISIGRVLHEDDAFVTLEVPKDMSRELRVEEGDQFLTLVFLHSVDDHMEFWKPWE